MREPKGRAFDLLLEFALTHCEAFSIGESELEGWAQLIAFELRGDEPSVWALRSGISPKERRRFFRLTRESVAQLKACEGLYSCPDDLMLHAPSGEVFFSCVAHEGEGGCDPTLFADSVVRPLMDELHRLDVAPSPDATRRVAPYMFPDDDLDELKARFAAGAGSIGRPGGPQLDEDNLEAFQEQMQRETAFAEFWGRRLSAGATPTAHDFRDAEALRFDLSEVVAGAAATGMLDRDQANAVLELVEAGWARGQVQGFLWLERLREAHARGMSPAQERTLLDQLVSLLDAPLNPRFVESIYDPNGSGLSALLFQALSYASDEGLQRLEAIAQSHPRISAPARTQLGSAVSERRHRLSSTN